MESPLVLALDTDDLEQAVAWSVAAGEAAGMVKVGLELFGAAGPAAVAALAGQGRRVMLDLKLHDIPATVAGGMRAAARAGAELVTVHALGGPAMLEAAVRAAGDRCRVAAVTILTSAGPADLVAAGLPPAAEAVPRLADLAVRSGCQAIVCSPLEAAALRTRLGPAVELVCPGVRPAGAGESKASPPASIPLGSSTRSGWWPRRPRPWPPEPPGSWSGGRSPGQTTSARPPGRSATRRFRPPPGRAGTSTRTGPTAGTRMVDLTLCEQRRVLTSADRLWPPPRYA